MKRWQLILTLAVVLGAMVLFFAWLPSWFWHPLGYCTGSAVAVRDCKGYNFHSGIGANFGELPTFAAVVTLTITMWHQRNCHHPGCLRLCWHTHPVSGHPVCKKHYSEEAHPDLLPPLAGGAA